jgi:hypothetical protein
MTHLEQLASEASIAVYVMASPDAREIEFLSLTPMATDEDRTALAARWHGRDLLPVGTIGRLADGRVWLNTRPLTAEAISTLLRSFALYCNANTDACGDSVEWCERLYALEDPRLN